MRIRHLPCLRPARRGNVLLLTLVIIGITSIGLVSYLSLVQSRMKLSGRAQSWNLSLPVAEAGIEEAMAHLNFSAGNNLASNGWTLTATNGYVKQVIIDSGFAYYTASISTGSPPVVRTAGFVRNPGTTRYISRLIEVQTTNLGNWKGLVSLQTITMESGCRADSYDSSNPLYSSNGVYKATLARQNGLLGTISKNANAADISGKVIGDFGTGASGVLKMTGGGVVGDLAYVNNPLYADTYQPGHLDTAFNTPFTAVTVPFTNGYFAPSAGSYSGTNYDFLFTGGKFFTTSISAPNLKILVTADSTLYIGDTFYMDNGTLAILPGVKLKMYVGKRFELMGTAQVNAMGRPDQFAYFGLPSNADVHLDDNSILSGTLMAPYARGSFEDHAVLSGAGVFLTTDLHGSFEYHFDESLGNSANRSIEIVSWNEL
jgi:hypothetical protein